MDLEQVKIFLAIVKYRSLSKASEMLALSQSTLSYRIASLENELAVKLIQRRKGQRYIELTPIGEKFIPIAYKWQQLWEETVNINEIDNTEILNISGVESICSYYLLPFFNIFSSAHKKTIKLFINICSSTLTYSLLESREADIGFVTIPIWDKNMILTPMTQENFCLICYDPENRWPAEVHPSDLAPDRELLQPWTPEYQQWHNYWWPNQKQFCIYINNSYLMQRHYLEYNNCWTIVTECIAQNYVRFPGFRAIKLLDPPQKRTTYMMVHKHPKRTSKDVIHCFSTELKRFLAARKLPNFSL